jgi:hypothetical protein
MATAAATATVVAMATAAGTATAAKLLFRRRSGRKSDQTNYENRRRQLSAPFCYAVAQAKQSAKAAVAASLSIDSVENGAAFTSILRA